MNERGLMSWENFEIILDKVAPYANFISLFNWGEPFVHNKLLDMISACHERGIKTHLDSNLSVRDFLNPEAEAIVRSGLFFLFGSIDGASSGPYRRYRRGGNFTRAIQNLVQIKRARERLGSETPGLLWCFYLNKYNEHEVNRARAMSQEMGIDIWFKQLSCPKGFQTSYVEKDLSIFGAPGNLNDMHPCQSNEHLEPFNLHPALFPSCRQPYTVGVINWNGDVYPCCIVSGVDFSLGNLLKQSWEEIWNGPKMSACRNFLYNYGPVQNTDAICDKVCKAMPSFETH